MRRVVKIISLMLAILAGAQAGIAGNLKFAEAAAAKLYLPSTDPISHTSLQVAMWVARVSPPVAGVVAWPAVKTGYYPLVSGYRDWRGRLWQRTGMMAISAIFAGLLGATVFNFLWPFSQAPAQRKMPKSDEKKLVRLGRFKLPHKFEAEHSLALGSTGTGKSQMIRAAAKIARAREQNALVLDINGELTTRLFRQEKDVMIAAHDRRSRPWSPLAEMTGIHDARRIAAAIVPEGEGSGAEWKNYARTFVQGCLISLWSRREEKPKNSTLQWLVAEAEIDEIRGYLGNKNPAAGLVGQGNEKMFASIRATASDALAGIFSLPYDAGFDGWSINRWVQNVDKNDSWLFVPLPSTTQENGFPLASLVAGFVVSSAMRLPESRTRRLWFFCDELGQYPQISALARALSLGRKYGLSCVHVVQTVAQLRAKYGKEGADILLNNYAQKLVYRCGDGETAGWASREIGDVRITRKTESRSKGSGKNSESVSESEGVEKSVLPSEIQSMQEFYAWIRSPALESPHKYQIPAVDIGEQSQPDFIPVSQKSGEEKKSKSKGGAPKKPAPKNVDSRKKVADPLDQILAGEG